MPGTERLETSMHLGVLTDTTDNHLPLVYFGSDNRKIQREQAYPPGVMALIRRGESFDGVKCHFTSQSRQVWQRLAE